MNLLFMQNYGLNKLTFFHLIQIRYSGVLEGDLDLDKISECVYKYYYVFEKTFNNNY